MYKRYYTFLGPFFSQPKAKAYTYLSLSLATIAFFVFFAIRPTVNTIIGLQKQIKDDREVETKLQEKINALSQFQVEYEIIRPDLPILDKAIPETPNINELIKVVEKLALDNEASLSAIQVGETFLSGEGNTVDKQLPNTIPRDKGLVLMPISKPAIPINLVFTNDGNYASIVKIVAAINRLPRLLSTKNITMVKGVNKIIASIKVDAYYLSSLKQ